MIETIYYTLLIIVCLIFSNSVKRTKHLYFSTLLFSLFLSFLLALRDIPGDFQQYKDAFLYYSPTRIREYEIGWLTILSSFKSFTNNLLIYMWLGVYFPQVFIFSICLKKDWIKIFPLFILIFIIEGITISSNLMRQWLSCCILLFGYIFFLKNITTKNIICYCCLVFIASFFHKSSLIAISAILLLNLKLSNKWLQISLLIIASISSSFISSHFNSILHLLSLLNFDKYNWYVDNIELSAANTSTGLGRIFYLIEACIISYYYPKLLKWYGTSFDKLYNLYFWGTTAYILLMPFHIISRIFLCYRIVYFIILPLTLFFLYKNDKKKLFYVLIIIKLIIFYKLVAFNDEVFGLSPIQFIM